MRITLEVIASTVADARAAEAGGADRLELVSGLTEGGLTPSYGMLEAIRRATSLPLFVMIRPRGGSFVYTPDEVEVMARDAAIARELGADGLVLGALTPEGELDRAALTQVLEAGRLPATCHRAFEQLQDKQAGLRELAALPGMERILTGGGKSPLDAAESLRELITAGGPIAVMLGSGITLENAGAVVQATGAKEIHVGTAVREPQNPLGTVTAERVRQMRQLLDGVTSL